MSSDYTHARLQRIEEHVRSLSETVSVLAAVDNEAAKQRIDKVFGSDPRVVVIYRGVQKGLTQQKIAEALRERGLPGTQQRVSEALTDLEKERFIERPRNGPPSIVPGWEPFGLERALKKTLKASGVADLA